MPAYQPPKGIIKDSGAKKAVTDDEEGDYEGEDYEDDDFDQDEEDNFKVRKTSNYDGDRKQQLISRNNLTN